jgi:hypothetical protein
MRGDFAGSSLRSSEAIVPRIKVGTAADVQFHVVARRCNPSIDTFV